MNELKGRVTVGEILSKVRNPRVAGKDRYMACCPAHDDVRPSLSIALGEKGIVLFCHGGCKVEEVCKALGIEMSQLFYDSEQRVACSVQEEARITACSVQKERRHVSAPVRYTPNTEHGKVILTFEEHEKSAIGKHPKYQKVDGRDVESFHDYEDEKGQTLFQVVRYIPKGFSQRRPDGKGGWVNSLGDVRRVLCNLPTLLETPMDQVVFIVEGEKDVDSMTYAGIVAVTNPGGAGKWAGLVAKDPSFQEPLRGRRVGIMGDNDEPGRKNARMIAESLLGVASEVRIVDTPLGAKDISLYMESDQGIWGDCLDEVIMAQYEQAAVIEPAGRSELVTTSLDEVQAKPVEWFWPNRIPAGMFSMVTGNPNMGKSFLMMYLAAVTSTGRSWPDCPSTMPAGTVLLVTGEESVSHAIKPRLEWNGADCSRVHILRHIEGESGQQFFDIKRHVAELGRYLDRTPDCRAIFIDPITSFLGSANENSNSEIRAALLGLMSLAESRKVTIIGVSHLNKKGDLKAIHRTLGSVAFAAAARSLWLVEADEASEDGGPRWRKFLPVKANLSVEASGLRFKVEDGRVEFDTSPVCQSADDAISDGGRMEARALDDAKDFLADQLKDGPKPAREIMDAAKALGFSIKTVRRASKMLSVVVQKLSMQSGWQWSLSSDVAA
jgi:putative DNA primase/helicase